MAREREGEQAFDRMAGVGKRKMRHGRDGSRCAGLLLTDERREQETER